MMNKSKSKNDAKKKPASKKPETLMWDEAREKLWASQRAAETPLDKRKELLARVAGSIAAGLVTSPSPSIASPSSMATAAVDIAEEILKQAGIPSIESSAESASPTRDVGVGAAS